MKPIQFSDLILVETDAYLVINKPPLISTLEDRANMQNILALAREYETDAQVCHRLDKETSGALVIAKNSEAYRHASLQFQNREVKKVYHAVAEGVHNFQQEEIDRPIRKLGNGKVCIDRRQGKESQTMMQTLTAYRHYTLVECKPTTGRMHQIRVHLADIGAPISGDITYGGTPFYLSKIKRRYHTGRGEEERPLISRLALHAFSIGFKDLNGDEIYAEAPYPKDFNVLLRQLDKNDLP